MRLPSPRHPFSTTGLIGCRSIFFRSFILFPSCIETNVDPHTHSHSDNIEFVTSLMCASLEAEVAGEKPHEDTGRKCKLHTDSAQAQELNPRPSCCEMLTTAPPSSDILSLCCLLIGLIQTSQPLFAEPAKVQSTCLSIVRSSSSVKTGRAGWCTSIRLPRVRPSSSSSTMSSSTCELLLHYRLLRVSVFQIKPTDFCTSTGKKRRWFALPWFRSACLRNCASTSRPRSREISRGPNKI